ncbi:MAG: hypothetical protein P8X63_03915 [Desulfuromonadaceae bacterium]
MEKFIVGFLMVWFVGAIFSVWYLIAGLKKANRVFGNITGDTFKFQEKGCSGYSKKSIFTRLGGARNVLEVIVTDKEFCIKGIMSIFTFIGMKYDLAHRVPLSNVIEVRQEKSNIELQLRTAEGTISNLVLNLKNPSGFLTAMNG